MVGIMLAGIVTVERDGLIANDAGRAIGRGRIDPMGVQVRFGAGHEEGADLIEAVEAGEIDIAAIHDVDSSRLREQQVEA